MKSKEERELEFLRGMEGLKASPIKSPDYTSPLGQDVMKVKSGMEKIDTKGISKIGNAADVMKANADKISRMKALKALGNKSSLGGLAGGLLLAAGTSMLPESAMASTPVQATTRALDEGDPTSMLLPSDVGPAEGSFDQRLESGQLTPEELELLRQQYQR